MPWHRRVLAAIPLTFLAVPISAAVPPARDVGARSELPVRMRFDPDLGVHVVTSHSGLYYFDRRFIRLRRGSWQFAESTAGPWRDRPAEWVPFGLRLRHYVDER